MEDSDHQIDPVSQSGQNLGSLDVWSPEIWGNLGDFGCYIISFFGKKLGSLDGTYIGIYRGPAQTCPDWPQKSYQADKGSRTLASKILFPDKEMANFRPQKSYFPDNPWQELHGASPCVAVRTKLPEYDHGRRARWKILRVLGV